jgi:hypothetical protein
MTKNERRAWMLANGAMIAYGTVSMLRLVHKPKKGEPVKEEPKEPAKHFGYEIVDECLCEENVSKYERHELVFHETEEKWYRLCAECINKRNQPKANA